jgi:hypothetical protein
MAFRMLTLSSSRLERTNRFLTEVEGEGRPDAKASSPPYIGIFFQRPV